MTGKLRFGLVPLAALVLSFGLHGYTRADDAKQVSEKAQKGETSRTGYYSADGKKERLDIYYPNGLWRMEVYDRHTGKPQVIREEFLKGWRRHSIFTAGVLVAEEVTRAADSSWEKVSSTYFQSDGGMVVSEYEHKRLDRVRLVGANGAFTDVWFNHDGVPSGTTTKGKREVAPDGTVTNTWLDDKGKATKSHQISKDGKLKEAFFKDGVLSSSSTYPTPVRLSYSAWTDEQNYKAGKLWCHREKQPDGGMLIQTYDASGKVVLFKQTWVKATATKVEGRVRNYMLSSVEYFDDKAVLSQKLTFDADGYKVAEVRHYEKGVLSRVATLRPDGYYRVNGTVSKVEYYKDGAIEKTKTYAAADNVSENLDRKDVMDPVFGESEPGLVRIIR